MKRARILVVDDEAFVRDVLQDILDSEGYEVVAVGSSTEALKQGGQKTFDLLLTDIKMPGIDGLELANRFRELDPQIMAILITGYPSLETARQAIHQGIHDYILKPFKKDELCATVAAALKRHERISGLEKAAHELEELEKARSQFVDVLSRELRAPLTPVLGSAGILAEQLGKKEGELMDRLAQNILSGAQGLRARLENLLVLARFEAGGLGLEIVPLDISRFLQGMASQFQPLAEKKGQTLVMELPEVLPVIKADRRCLEQVITNLLDNAVKSTPKGGEIRLRATVSDRDVVVEIEDNGPSLSPEEQKRLLQAYWQSEVDTQGPPGIGLGLAVCKKLVEAHGGRLWIRSEGAKGKTFAFAIPIEGPSVGEKPSK